MLDKMTGWMGRSAKRDIETGEPDPCKALVESVGITNPDTCGIEYSGERYEALKKLYATAIRFVGVYAAQKMVNLGEEFSARHNTTEELIMIATEVKTLFEPNLDVHQRAEEATALVDVLISKTNLALDAGDFRLVKQSRRQK